MVVTVDTIADSCTGNNAQMKRSGEKISVLHTVGQLIDEGEDVAFAMVRRLLSLRAIGEESAWRLVMECFAWRRFHNRREAGAYVGLTPTPFNTGNSSREQGIGKDGNQRLRALLIELAWIWLRYQPDSALTRWFQERYACGGKRSRRVGVVALARKLFIALWHYVDHGVVPEGAILKA